MTFRWIIKCAFQIYFSFCYVKKKLIIFNLCLPLHKTLSRRGKSLSKCIEESTTGVTPTSQQIVSLHVLWYTIPSTLLLFGKSYHTSLEVSYLFGNAGVANCQLLFLWIWLFSYMATGQNRSRSNMCLVPPCRFDLDFSTVTRGNCKPGGQTQTSACPVFLALYQVTWHVLWQHVPISLHVNNSYASLFCQGFSCVNFLHAKAHWLPSNVQPAL